MLYSILTSEDEILKNAKGKVYKVKVVDIFKIEIVGVL